MKILSIICCYSLPFTNSEKEMPNILLQVAAKWDGESNPARMEASVIFLEMDIPLAHLIHGKIAM